MKQNKETLKSYFETGDKPTENHFADLIDSYIDAKQPEGEANRRFVIDEAGEVSIASEQQVSEYTLSPISGTNTVDLLKDGVSVSQIDLTPYLDDTNLARLVSGTVDANGLATFTRDDDTTFTVDLSNLKETQVQVDFNQTDDTQPDYIKNKPTTPTLNDVLNEDNTSVESIHLTGTGDKFSINLDGEYGEAGLRLGSSAQVYRMVINQPSASLNQPTSLDFTTTDGIATKRILRLTKDKVITGEILHANKNIVVNGFDPFIEIKDNNQNEVNSTVLKISNNTAERTITFPDANGTIALISNIPQLQAGSNITIDNADSQNPIIKTSDAFINQVQNIETTLGNKLDVNSDGSQLINVDAVTLNGQSDFLNLNSGGTVTGATTFNSDLAIGTKIVTGNAEDVLIGFGQQASTGEKNNVGIGTRALQSITFGNDNIAIGLMALAYLETGQTNVGIGRMAGYYIKGSYNVAIGNAALYGLSGTTINSGNVAIGEGAGAYINGGFTNNTQSQNSIYIGFVTKSASAGTDNEIVIGANAEGQGSNTVTIGNSSITDTYLEGTTHSDSFKVRALNSAPASASAPGTVGEIRYTSDYIYVCVAANTWKRTELSTW
ncbi:hypothetical protein [Tenacibaculum larymnensis]|uniref:Trimeric autotransporter adhesin YadA-like head domain-containing protein n=1 Tax=Tenacibaculum larymnensis TaxID=2878201 RepID=A0A9X4EKB9_9FLAO|nr:hypothetical protein [Tenacibaculum larymnensis]MDE1205562.1 hypothetical protein [Tenacibaculum larymnensis]